MNEQEFSSDEFVNKYALEPGVLENQTMLEEVQSGVPIRLDIRGTESPNKQP